jgi:hypothetical protein
MVNIQGGASLSNGRSRWAGRAAWRGQAPTDLGISSLVWLPTAPPTTPPARHLFHVGEALPPDGVHDIPQTLSVDLFPSPARRRTRARACRRSRRLERPSQPLRNEADQSPRSLQPGRAPRSAITITLLGPTCFAMLRKLHGARIIAVSVMVSKLAVSPGWRWLRSSLLISVAIGSVTFDEIGKDI